MMIQCPFGASDNCWLHSVVPLVDDHPGFPCKGIGWVAPNMSVTGPLAARTPQNVMGIMARELLFKSQIFASPVFLVAFCRSFPFAHP